MVTAIIQARTGSTRLPGKVLKKIRGKSLLEHLILRLKKSKELGDIVIATTTDKKDDSIATIGKEVSVGVFRGSEKDVLDRYYQAAQKFKADHIVRITGDCPLMDPEIVDKVVRLYKKGNYDYVSNTYPPTFPDGMDVEIFSFGALEKAWKNSKLPSEREHVTIYIRNKSNRFHIGNLKADKDFSNLRLTVDEPQDLVLVRKIFSNVYSKKKFFTLKDVIRFLDKTPKLLKINNDIERNEGLKKSLQKEKIK